MADTSRPSFEVLVVDEQVEFTLGDLSHACRVQREQLIALVDEGVLQPMGEQPEDWRFSGAALSRARTAVRLSHDLELTPSGVAMVVDLLDEIESLRSRLRRAGIR